jgi:hypothetical protein
LAFHSEFVADIIQHFLVGIADREVLDTGMVEIDGHELGPEAETDESDTDLIRHHISRTGAKTRNGLNSRKDAKTQRVFISLR